MAHNPNRFCSCLTVAPPSAQDAARLAGQRPAVLKMARWDDGAIINIRFLDGDPQLQARVRNVACEWIQPGLADLRFNFVDEGPADIRIAFIAGDGSWSYLGTQCQQIPEPEPTMNYGWLTPESDDDELRRVVLHEFGHALGLIHEHMHPQIAIEWDRERVIADLSGPPGYWDEETIEQNVLLAYAAEQIDGTPPDPTSIMMYPIPARWTRNGFSTGLNSTLSPLDRYLVSNIYPQ